MASVERRDTLTRGPRYRVLWREHGQRQQQAFTNLDDAHTFQRMVEVDNRWPVNWDRLRACRIEDAPSGAPSFRAFAGVTILYRERADQETKRGYTAMLKRHVFPVIGDLAVDRVTRFDVAEVAARMRQAGRSPKTVANVHALLSSILRDAVTDRLIDRNPAVGVLAGLPTSRTEEMVFLTPQEFATLVRLLQPRHRPLAWLLAGTGLRWSEATALQVGDVDLLGRKSLQVQRAWKRRGGLFELGDPKSRRSRRTVSLSDELVDILVPLVAGKKSTELVFQAEHGGQVRHSYWYNKVWLPAVAEARRVGVLDKQPRIHDLRHSHVAWLIDEKVTLVAIQHRLGHESINTTIGTYGHLSPDHVREIDAAVDRALAVSGKSTL